MHELVKVAAIVGEAEQKHGDWFVREAMASTAPEYRTSGKATLNYAIYPAPVISDPLFHRRSGQASQICPLRVAVRTVMALGRQVRVGPMAAYGLHCHG